MKEIHDVISKNVSSPYIQYIQQCLFYMINPSNESKQHLFQYFTHSFEIKEKFSFNLAKITFLKKVLHLHLHFNSIVQPTN